MFTYPHMCRDGHVEIGHGDSEHELCPLCQLLAEVARLQQERDAAQIAMSYCSNQAHLEWTLAHLEWTRAEKAEAENATLRTAIASELSHGGGFCPECSMPNYMPHESTCKLGVIVGDRTT